MSNFFKYYFLGIGGIGMSALARYFNAKGFKTGGYDRTPTSLTKSLQAEGIEITFDESLAALPEYFTNPKSTMVILTPAVPENHPQLVYFRENNFTICKRAQVLGEITRQQKGICIAGTHGKTTTSTITAHLLYQSHISCNAFLGGIANNYKTNLLICRDAAHHVSTEYVVVEADEYDRSFHQLTPFMAVITSMDADHLDIYETSTAFREGFEHFASLIRPGGSLIVRKSIELHPKLQEKVKTYTYSMNDGGDFHAENIRYENDRIYFDFVAPTVRIDDLYLSVPILINVENSVAAIALAWLNGVTKEEIRMGISTFSGIHRRFETVYKSDKTVYIDDYAHHPTELRAGISSIRKLYPDRKIIGIFQPHLYTRTRDFAKEFADELSQLDELILLDIYPARELPIEGVSSEILLKNVKLKDKTLCSKENLLSLLRQKNLDVLVTFGAGDIDQLVPEIKKELEMQAP